VDGPWATTSEDVGLIVRAISFQDFQPMLSWSTNVTDGQTDVRSTDGHMQPEDRALHYCAPHCKSIQCKKRFKNAKLCNVFNTVIIMTMIKSPKIVHTLML